MLQVKEFYDKQTSTLTYVIWDPRTRDAAAIDPVLDYDPASSKTSETSASEVLKFIRSNELKVHYVLETHAHADHLSGAQVFKREIPSLKIGVGERIREVQATFKNYFGLSPEFKIDGSQFDVLFKDGEVVNAGSLKFKTISTPGHTPACFSYLFNDEFLFTGDALFMPDYGTGRCDFPGASAEVLYDSIHERIYSLPGNVKTFTGHDYLPGGRELRFMCSIDEQRSKNIHLRSETTKPEFVKFRTERDKTLSAPKLLLASVQINIDAGHLPPVDSSGRRFLRIPIQ